MTEPTTIGPFDQTWFCNLQGYDIQRIKPYAAYDVGADEWVVKPPHLPHWSLSELPKPVQQVLRAADSYARRVLKLPEPERTQQGAALFEAWHSDRSRAFGPQGEGWWDIANLREKYGDQAGWWAQLVDCAHRAKQGLGAAPADWSNIPTGYVVTAKLPKTQKCDYCKQQATKRVIWAEGMGYIPVCDEHEQRAKDHVGDDYCNTRPIPKTASHPTMYHWAPKDARDDIAEHGLDHTQAPDFNPDRQGPHGVFLHHNEDLARDWVPDIERTHDLYAVDTHGLSLRPDPYDTGDASYTEHRVPPDRFRRVTAVAQVWITPQLVMGSAAGLNHARQVNSASEAVAAVQQGLTAVLPPGAWFPVRQVLLGLGMSLLDVTQRLKQFGAPSSVTG